MASPISAPDDHGPGVRVPPPILVGLLVGIGWMLHRAVPVPVSTPAPNLAALLMALGMAVSVWTVVTMLRAGVDQRPDRPDKALLERGPFRFSRNPIYLGFLVVVAGFALHWGDLWPWLAVLATFLVLGRHVVVREEQYLRARFGAPYAAYLGRVRRWI
jgi:protein-S-isoprenylcysteine O-methyltransferase Ste14